MKTLLWTDRKKGLLAAITTALCWSFLSLFLKFALQYSDSYTIVWYRMFVAFIGLLIYFSYTKRQNELIILKSKPGRTLLAALALAFNYVGFMQGVHYTSPASAQVFIQIGPLLLALAGFFIFKEKLSSKQTIGFIFCTFGFSLFFSDRLSAVTHTNQNFFLGFSWIMAAAITWAFFAILQKKLLLQWKSPQLNIYIYMISSLIFLPLVDWTKLSQLPLIIHFFYIFLGLNTILAYGCLSVALKYLPATQVSPIITINPLLTLALINIIAWMDWNFIPADPIGLSGYIGAFCAIAGIIFVLTKKSRPKSK